MVEPHRYDVFALAMPLCRETQDYEALRWVCLEYGSKAWPKEVAKIYDEAEMLAKVTHLRLSQEGRVLEAKAFEEQVKSARQRDVAVRVNWTGEADLDIRVKEPAGTICSLPIPSRSAVACCWVIPQSDANKSIDGFSEFLSAHKATLANTMIRKAHGESLRWEGYRRDLHRLRYGRTTILYPTDRSQ